MGTLPKLVEALCLPSGELDTIFLDVLLTTYQSFTSSTLLLNAVIQWFERMSEDGMSSQKENCKRFVERLKKQNKPQQISYNFKYSAFKLCLFINLLFEIFAINSNIITMVRSMRDALLTWVENFEVDFYDPPSFPALINLHSFAFTHFPATDLSTKIEEKLNMFVKSDENFGSNTVANLGTESILDAIDCISSSNQPVLIPPLDIFIIPSSYFAEQLTFIDAKLFCDVVPRHCLGSVWSRRNDKKLSASLRPHSVLVTVEQFNSVSFRVISTILKWPYASLSCRVALIEKWITIAQECRRLKNFSSLKAILAGLQSNSVFRLKKVWNALSKEKADTFKELAAIFSEDNNQALWREILNKEGTAKNAELETSSMASKTSNNNRTGNRFSLFANNRSKFSNSEITAMTRTAPSVQGTVPYLGTFLTDLTMLDTAFPDVDPETTMINFEKKRREFEILAQIKILQSTCNFYKITPDPSFLDWFYGIRTYDENESHELSLEIEPSHDTITKDKVKGHKKNMSLGYFTVKKHNLFVNGDDCDDATELDATSEDRRSAQSLKEMPALSKILSSQVDTLSFISTRTTMSDLTHRRSTSNLFSGSNQIHAKVELVCDQSHSTNFYKSILVSNQDHVSNVMKKIFKKFDIDASPEDFYLCQRLENKREIELPERGNLFYAIKTSNEVRLIVRRKGEGRSKNKSKSRGVSALPGSRESLNCGRLTRIFNSMVSLVPS